MHPATMLSQNKMLICIANLMYGKYKITHLEVRKGPVNLVKSCIRLDFCPSVLMFMNLKYLARLGISVDESDCRGCFFFT